MKGYSNVSLVQLCKAKLNKAVVTSANIDYSGSLSIDQDILDYLGVYNYEKVMVVNRDNGQRFETYIMAEKPGSRIIGLNGGAAKLGKVGDTIGFVAFCIVDESNAHLIKPKICELGSDGKIIEIKK